ncbi:MAG: sugar ABC transporter permease [Bacillota bacterium]|nr:sugar ABC transporter permease [Bacillota bacterium]
MLETAKKQTLTEQKFVYKRRMKPGERRDLWISRFIIWIFLFAAIFPIISIVFSSLSTGDAFFSDSFFPKQITFKNYTALFDGSLNGTMNFGKCLLNSLELCFFVVIIQVFMTGTSSYAFSRMKFKGRKYGLMSLLIIQMFPMMMTVGAVYIMLYMFHVMDKIWALSLFLAGGSAFNIWLMKGFIDGLPRELDEAAMVDGATHWQVFTKVIVPLAKPMFAVILLFCFMGAYSEYVFSSVALTDPNNYTVAVALQQFISNQMNQHWTQFSAAAVIASVPQVIIFLFLQKFLQGGLTAGAVKG